MFENSILVKPQIICQWHPKQKVSSVCTDLQCQNAPLLCPNCITDLDIKNKHLYHEVSIKNSWEGLNDIAATVQRDRVVIDRLYKQTACKKENQQLIRWQQDRVRHYASIENHLNSIKYQLDEEIKSVYRLFEAAIQQAKQQIVITLDSYFKTYKQNFEIFSKMIEPLVEYGRSHKYYANVNSLTIKLLTESPKRGNDWLVELKSTLNSIQHISAGILPFEQSLDRATTYMNAMIDSLPITEYDEQRAAKIINSVAIDILRSSIKICDLKNLNLILNTVNTTDLEDKRLGKKVGIFDPNLRRPVK